MNDPIANLIEEARDGPECFKCGEPISFSYARIVTVRVGGEPRSAWVHASHARPADKWTQVFR